jgi:Domain of unknown function (DUF4304)
VSSKQARTKFISLKFVPFLKKNGFKKVGYSFIVKNAAITKIVDFQPASYAFTINLGIHFDDLNSFLINSVQLPRIAQDCHLSVRIGLLGEPPMDRWWTCGGIMVDVSKEIEDSFDFFIKYGYPWLENCTNYRAALNYNDTINGIECDTFVIPSMLIAIGDKDAAISELIDSFANFKISSEQIIKSDRLYWGKKQKERFEIVANSYNEYTKKNSLAISFEPHLNLN